jgi:hypothetical protein
MIFQSRKGFLAITRKILHDWKPFRGTGTRPVLVAKRNVPALGRVVLINATGASGTRLHGSDRSNLFQRGGGECQHMS